MLRPRIIPTLLVKGGGLVKTVRFASPKYVGDPINAVKIFNEKEVDELIVLDIDASVNGREPNYTMIRDLASECRMPLCYGGGVKTLEQAQRIVGMGVEKVAVSSAAMDDPALISQMARVLGSQSVTVVIDAKAAGRGAYEVRTLNGNNRTSWAPPQLATKMQELGAGEIVLNSIDNDGVMKGYDMELVSAVRAAVNVPITVVGGAGSLADVRSLVQRFGIIGAAAGSLFVFKGALRAVLINYPSRSEKDSLLA